MKNKLDEVVLVVDDSPESLGMLNVALNNEGYTALVAISGVQALSITEKVTPDIILLDAVMPEMDGFETCKRLKQKLPETPVVFMTGLTDKEDVVKGFEAGGTDYVTKPIAPEEVIARIKSHLQNSRLARSARDALDHAGKYVFCVNDSGQLAWATPHVNDMIDAMASHEENPWYQLAEIIKDWLRTDPSCSLTIDDFEEPIHISYERKQESEGLHLLRMSQSCINNKTPEQLKEALPVTKRESEVLYWLSFGKTNWEIAQILSLSHRTINKHLEQIYKKIGVDNRTSAAAISVRILES